MSTDLRANIARWFSQIAFDGLSANQVNQSIEKQLSNSRDAAFAKQCMFGSARHFERLNWIAQSALDKPLKAKEKQLKALLITALYQLLYLDTPEHAVLSESVNASRALNRPWASGLINGVLRQVSRDKARLMDPEQQPENVQHQLPEWLLKRLKNAWPKHWQTIGKNSNIKAPLTLRANQRFGTEQAKDALHQANIGFRQIEAVESAYILEHAIPVQRIPGFEKGDFSVQDLSAQLAAILLPVKAGDQVLDACAAPGGKTAHLLERNEIIELTALELEPRRADKIKQNLDRIGLHCELIIGDASQWQSQHKFDAILIDAPCSATGVIRRQPDIKLHRQDDDIYPTVQLQRAILDNLWPQLKPGGHLLYATCSILPDENHKQIKRFLKQTPNAELIPISVSEKLNSKETQFGLQLFPSHINDGFFYALLRKQPGSL